ARFEGDVEDGARQAPAADLPGGRPQREDLRVRGRVAPKLALVARRRDHLAVASHDGADRDVAVRRRALGLAQREAHDPLVLLRERMAVARHAGSIRQLRAANRVRASPMAVSWPGPSTRASRALLTTLLLGGL